MVPYRRVALRPRPAPSAAHGLIAMLGPGDFLLAGSGFKVTFTPRPGHGSQVEVLSVDEGRFEHGAWVRGRRLNGDEWAGALSLGDRAPGYSGERQTLHIRRVRLHAY